MGSLAVKPETRFFRYSVVSTEPIGADGNPFEIVQRLDEALNPGDAVVVEVDGFVNSMALTHVITMWRQAVSRGAVFRCIVLNPRSWRTIERLGLTRNIDFRLCPRKAPSERCSVCEDTHTCEVRHRSGI